jgi:hypothetical protein
MAAERSSPSRGASPAVWHHEDPEVALKARVDGVARHEAPVDSADVADHVPHPFGCGVDQDLLANGSYEPILPVAVIRKPTKPRVYMSWVGRMCPTKPSWGAASVV